MFSIVFKCLSFSIFIFSIRFKYLILRFCIEIFELEYFQYLNLIILLYSFLRYFKKKYTCLNFRGGSETDFIIIIHNYYFYFLVLLPFLCYVLIFQQENYERRQESRFWKRLVLF